MASLLSAVRTRFFDKSNKPLAGGKVYTYEANSTNPKVTWSDEALTVQNTNPVLLDNEGTALIFFSGKYRFRIEDKYGVLIEDNPSVTSPVGIDGVTSDIVKDGNEDQKSINDKNIQEVSNVDMLRALAVRKDGQLVRTNCHTKEGFGGGIYRFESLSSKVDNNGTYIASTAAAGTWVLQDNLKFEHFGVTDDDIDQSTRVQKCIDYALENAITCYGFEKAFKCRIDNTLVFSAVPNPTDWGMPTDRTEVTMNGTSFVSSVNNLTYIRILRDRVEFKDTLAVDGKGSTGQIGIALGYEKTDDPMDTS
ncbi:hypothetical protein NQ658_18525, partial [Acinetobacter baumannii]|nr:hypothetical protein [Acinetobacter baumannii]